MLILAPHNISGASINPNGTLRSKLIMIQHIIPKYENQVCTDAKTAATNNVHYYDHINDKQN